MSVTLGEAFDFTTEDLAENRQGRLSQRQMQRVRQKWGKRQRATAFWAIVLAGIAVVVLLPIFQTMSLEGNVGRLVGGTVLALVALLFFSGLLEKPPSEIQSVQGKAQFVRRTSDTNVEGQNISETSHYVVVGDKEFQVNLSQYEAFTQGHIYKVYYGPYPLETLSMEYIGPPEE